METKAHEIVLGWVPLEADSVICVQKVYEGGQNSICQGRRGAWLGRGKAELGMM